MPEEVRLWKIKDESELVHVPWRALDLEERLEEWIARDPSILDPEFLIVGRQVETKHGGYIDLMCLNQIRRPISWRRFLRTSRLGATTPARTRISPGITVLSDPKTK